MRYTSKFLSIVLTFVVSVTLVGSSAQSAPPLPRVAENACDHAPDPPGNANGIHKRCDVPTSSSGIVKADFNGDGFADLAVGVPNQTVNGVANSGAVYVIYGSNSGLTSSGGTLTGHPVGQTWTVANTGPVDALQHPNSNFGYAVAGGDFNADGYSDLAILIRKYTFSTSIFNTDIRSDVVVLYGSADGLVIPPVQDLGIVCYGGDLADGLAWGDFNGDGVGDLAIGCGHNSPPYVQEFDGQRAIGLDELHTNSVNPKFPDNLKNGTQVVLAAGDFNGDGRTDLSIGVPDMDLVDTTSFFCLISGCPVLQSEVGAVAVLYGSTPAFLGGIGLKDDVTQVWRQGANNVCCHTEAGAHFGAALASGDFNGDTRQDLAIGLPGGSVGGVAGAGAVVIIKGASGGLTSTGTDIWNENAIGGAAQISNAFASALAAGDFNGDGYLDLAIGIPFENLSGYPDAGQVDVIYGSPSGLSTSGRSPQFWHQGNGIGGTPTSGGHYGSQLSAWNFGKNEVTLTVSGPRIFVATDLAIGIRNQTVNGVANAGAVNVLYGSHFSNGLVSSGNQLLTQDDFIGGSVTADHFGFAMY
jgi:FG-GAP repeat protein